MNAMVVGAVFIAANELSPDIRKNNTPVIKTLVKSKDNSLLSVKYEGVESDKETLRKKITEVLGTEKFHLEQVFTLAKNKYNGDNSLDIIYIAVTNIENIKEDIDDEYKIVDLEITEGNLKVGDIVLDYETIEDVKNGNIEYRHEVKTNDINLEKNMLEMLIPYKYLRKRVDYTDIIFKFMPEKFTLEDVRTLYEKIKNQEVDKSNYRKKILPYVEKTNDMIKGKGYRPTQLFKFKVNLGDTWL